MNDVYVAIHQRLQSAASHVHQVAKQRHSSLLLHSGCRSNSAYAYSFYGSLMLSPDPESDEDLVICANVKFAEGALEVYGDISMGDGAIIVDWPVELVACDGEAEIHLLEWSVKIAERILAAQDVMNECLAQRLSALSHSHDGLLISADIATGSRGILRERPGICVRPDAEDAQARIESSILDVARDVRNDVESMLDGFELSEIAEG